MLILKVIFVCLFGNRVSRYSGEIVVKELSCFCVLWTSAVALWALTSASASHVHLCLHPPPTAARALPELVRLTSVLSALNCQQRSCPVNVYWVTLICSAHFFLNVEPFQGRNPVVFSLWASSGWRNECLLNEWMTAVLLPQPISGSRKYTAHAPSTMSFPRGWWGQYFCSLYHAFRPALKSQSLRMWLCKASSFPELTPFVFVCFSVTPRGMQDLSSLTRDWTRAPCCGSTKSNRWTTKEVLPLVLTMPRPFLSPHSQANGDAWPLDNNSLLSEPHFSLILIWEGWVLFLHITSKILEVGWKERGESKKKDSSWNFLRDLLFFTKSVDGHCHLGLGS